MPVINRIAAFQDDMTAWRRDLHAHPELSLQEHRTSAAVQEKLRAFGVDEVHTGLAGTGVVGVIRGRAAGDAIGLRADMDALPITEESGVAHASTNPGVMHACGHDGHTAMLLGAARYLAETRNFAGTAYVIFQPAEERHGGGGIMVREGLFERFPMRQVFGMHNWPRMPAGTFLWRDGPTMAACATVEITVTGRGSHAAQPHLGVDPIVAASHLVVALQSIVARNVDPTESGVVSVGSISGGNIHNVIPESVRLLGTARWFVPAVGDVLESGVRRVAQGVAETFGVRVDVTFERTYPAVVNDPVTMARARDAAEVVAGADAVRPMERPTMGGEDFSYMMQLVPGAFIMLGGGKGDDDPALHHPRYDFNDEILAVGASFWATLVERSLPVG